MESKIILKKYAYYYDYLQKMGRINMGKNVTIEDLDLSRGAVQAGYKEMKEMEFDGNFVYYLCYISTLLLINVASKNSSSALQTAINIIDNYPNYQEDTINLLRLFMRNPRILLQILSEKYYDKEKKDNDDYNYKVYIDEFKIFVLLSSSWYKLFPDKATFENKIFAVEDIDVELKMWNLITQLIDG